MRLRNLFPLFTTLWTGLLLLPAPVSAQRPDLAPGLDGNRPVPTVTFEWASGSAPAHYAIALDSDGRAAYRSDQVGNPGAPESRTGAPYLVKFTVSPATAARIFALARQANYFAGDPAVPQPRPGNPNIKTLRYGEGPDVFFGHPTRGQRNTLTYDAPKSPAVQQLTELFEHISATLELGRRLDQLRRSDKTALPGELQQAEALARSGQLAELQAIATPLQSLAEDQSVPAAARHSARRLLALAASP